MHLMSIIVVRAIRNLKLPQCQEHRHLPLHSIKLEKVYRLAEHNLTGLQKHLESQLSQGRKTMNLKKLENLTPNRGQYRWALVAVFHQEAHKIFHLRDRVCKYLFQQTTQRMKQIRTSKLQSLLLMMTVMKRLEKR